MTKTYWNFYANRQLWTKLVAKLWTICIRNILCQRVVHSNSFRRLSFPFTWNCVSIRCLLLSWSVFSIKHWQFDRIFKQFLALLLWLLSPFFLFSVTFYFFVVHIVIMVICSSQFDMRVARNTFPRWHSFCRLSWCFVLFFTQNSIANFFSNLVYRTTQ